MKILSKAIGSLVLSALFLIVANIALGAEKYEVDKAHSSIGFKVSHMVIAKVSGRFTDYDVELMFDQKDVTKSSLRAAIKTVSIQTANEQRDNHLRSGDFFEVEKYPEITFKSKNISKKGENKYSLKGDITIKGVTKEIEFPFTLMGPIEDPMGNTRFGAEAHLEINRQNFGVSWNMALDNGGLIVSDIVEIELIIEAMRQK